MLSKAVDRLPVGRKWRYEPKWDGFRCLVHRDGDHLTLRSKTGKPLERYFPEFVDLFLGLRQQRFVLDGEILCDSFDRLQLRLHPAASRISRMAEEHPARFMAFDMLVGPDGTNLTTSPLSERRAALQKFLGRGRSGIGLSVMTADRELALTWPGGM